MPAWLAGFALAASLGLLEHAGAHATSAHAAIKAGATRDVASATMRPKQLADAPVALKPPRSRRS
jgi:hypothetical protein